MKILRARKIYEGDARVSWLGEDESGAIAAVSDKVVIAPPGASSEPIVQPLLGEPLNAFTSGRVLTLLRGAEQAYIVDAMGGRLPVPTLESDVFDSCWSSSSRTLFVLAKSRLVATEIDTGASTILFDELRDPSEGGKYELLLMGDNIVAAYRYGFCAWSLKGSLLGASNRPYSILAHGDKGEFIATGPSLPLVVLDPKGTVRCEVAAPVNSMHSMARVGRVTIAFWSEGRLHRAGEITRSGVRSIQDLHEGEVVEAVTVDRSGGVLWLGTIDGIVIGWQPHSGRRIVGDLGSKERIVQLCWSTHRNQLVVGTREGSVYLISVAD